MLLERIRTLTGSAVVVAGCVLASACDTRRSADQPPTSTPPTEQPYWVEEVLPELQYPWAMAWLPSGEMLITERLGNVRRVRDGMIISTLKGVPRVLDYMMWDGLFEIEIDPDFAQNRLIYLTYTDGSPQARVGKIFKARLENGELLDGRVIFESSPPLSSPAPIVMRILFLPDDTMLVGVGGGDWNPEFTQRLDNHIGKVIRIQRDGTAPPDNPFLDVAGAQPQIWVRGLRNPTGLAQLGDGSVWAVDIGPKGGDELNQLTAGANYGWPLATWGFEYSGRAVSARQDAPSLAAPALVWSPSHTPSDLTYYQGHTYPFWSGDLFTGGLSGTSVRRIRIRDGQVVLQERLLAHFNERFRSVQIGPDNLIYLLTDGSPGRLLRLRAGMPTEHERSRVAEVSTRPSDLQSQVRQDCRDRSIRLAEAADRQAYHPKQGQEHFARNCSACHRLGAFTAGQIGPDLNGIFGRPSGTAPGFDYSPALSDPKTRIVWSRETLLNFLTCPSTFFPGTKMAISPITDPIAMSSIVDFLLEKADAGTSTRSRSTH